MPSSVPTNRATIPGTSRSQPRWDPEDVLNLCVDGLCFGYAPSKHRECHKRIRRHDVYFLVTEIAKKQPDPERIRPDLVNLANHGLCYLHRHTQGEALVNEWTSNIRAAFPVELDRTQGRRSAMQSQPATVAFTPAQLEAIRAQIEQIVQQVRQELGPSNSTTPPRYHVASSAAAESVNAPSEIPPTPSTSLGRAARSAVNTTPRVATGSARSSNRPDIAAAPVGRTEAISGRTSSFSATSLPNVSQVVPRPSPQRCQRPHARRLPFNEECPICYEGGPLSECDASEIVWCRSSCGQSVHKKCFDDWRAQCVIDCNRLTCGVCRSDWDEHSGCNSCDAVHARRQAIEGDCAICRDVLAEDGSTAASDEGLVWCKDSCGQSVHQQCFDGWKRQCVADGRAATCVSCRASWSEGCDC
jgi:hypothetical protein